ncbi:MAG: 7TM diverse intracellular signaling domain-containing protein [Flammeovirgaceae bacterium]
MKVGNVLSITIVIALMISGCQGITTSVQEEHIFPLADLEYLIDSTNQLTIDQLADTSNRFLFSKKATYQNKDFKVNQTYWIKFRIPPTSATTSLRLLEFYDQTIDSLVVFANTKQGVWNVTKMGDHLPFGQRTFRHKNFEIVYNPTLESGLYYFMVKSHVFADIRIAYRTINRFVYYALNEYFLYGTFYGMILIIALYNLLAFFAIREIKNVYYVFYILSVALYAMSLDGTGFQYLWPQWPEWNDYSVGVSLYLVIIWAVVFTRRFLSTKTQAPILDKLLITVLVVRTLLLLFALFISPVLLAFQNIDILPLLVIFYAGIFIWRNGYRPARYFVIAYGLLFFGFFIKTLVYFDILPFTILSHYSLHLSFVFEMLFLTIALGDRIRILKDNRDRALRRIIHQHEVNMQLKDKVNRELEEKVKERTLELDSKNLALEKSNLKLEKQAAEISQINSMLDLDNWKLKNRVKEVLEERLHEKTMSYDEFKTLYPDTLACYRFIEELKNKRAFHCKKCNNNKYFSGSGKFAKRCTKCGYNESITSFTLFHGTKISIEKAFFIAYLTAAHKKGITLESISHQLDLRLNTVWAFKKKVLEHLNYLEKKGYKVSASKWEELILIQNATSKLKSNQYLKVSN